MTSTALSRPTPDRALDEELLFEDRVALRSKDAARAAVAKAFGDKATPELQDAAAEVVAPWARKLVRGLDDLVRVPGTKFGIGLDAILGFVLPGAGDVLTGTGSIALLYLALKERVPTVALLKMVLNIFVDTLGGLLPVVGDAFDLFWRSNVRNLDIIEKYKGDPQAKPSTADHVVVAIGLVLAIASIVLPFLVLYGFGAGVIAYVVSLFA